MNVLFVASEMAPFAKTGGLADVMGALPAYLCRAGHDARVVMPLYDRVDTSKAVFHAAFDITVTLGAHRYAMKVFRVDGPPTVYFLHCPALYARPSLYTQDADEHRRFLALQWASLQICERVGFMPHVIHAHDWQAALLPMIVKARKLPIKTLLTIHNLMYQGSFPVAVGPDTELGRVSHLFHQELMNAGRLNFLLQGILFADGVSTVSPTYAKEIQGETYGGGLDPYLRARSSTVVGILNGVDYDEWSPEKDRFTAVKYSAGDLAGKEQCKQQLLTALGLPYQPGVPVVGVVSRLVSQKGFKLFDPVMFELLRTTGFQLVVLGSGEAALEGMFHELQRQFPRQVCFYNGFKNDLAHLIEAGADMFCMPSVYEPCGLNQLYSLRYGTVPIVHKTGGLADTVEQWNPRTGQGTGFAFEKHDTAGLRWALEAALTTYRDKAQWARLVGNGMAKDFSWDAQGRLYELVYSRLMGS